MLTLNLNLLYTVVNILVLFLLLRKFLYKPVMNIIAQRQKQVDDALNAAETSKQEAAATLNDAQAKLRNVDAEAAARRTAYEQQAEKDKQQLLADAQKQADAILAEGKAAAEAERQHKLRQADAQTTALARAMCEKLLARSLNEQDDARLLDDLLEKAGAEMASEFSTEFFSANRIVKADLRAARTPREEDLERIKKEVAKLYDATEVILNVTVDDSLLSGYVLQIGDRVFDNSGRHAIDQMMADKPSLATLKTRIEDYKPAATSEEGGVVISSADGIVEVEGMDRAVYGEIVTFENGAKGMVESVEPGRLGIMLFDGAETVGVGTMVTRSGKRAGIPVGDGFLGRVIDPLGEPIDGKGPIEAVGYNPIEKQAPGILERQSVDTPLHTGILAIDSMFPIGRGQRELIIGDRQTGKTSIATDAILNQKDTGVLCIYVAIGQKASSIARVAEDLKKHGAMSYTTIVAATASDSAPLQYIAPYAGTALAEYFMAQGKSVLIVYDDLSKHAVAYRAISLLLRRSPGREAYPGDVFYLHSRLLERSCRMSDALGGGSITALPIVETQAGDVSAYIPTNVISITDGQIFLESALFNAGNRPAVNVGLSVSRVGGAAQTKAMKKANANLRIELAQYKDMESFAQFSSDLDAETRHQLEHGKALTEMLKQPLYQPKTDAEQVVILVLASHGMLDEVPLAEQRARTAAFVRQFHADVSGTMDAITATGKLTPEQTDTILNAWKAYEGGESHGVQ